jgi:hypothetical protein
MNFCVGHQISPVYCIGNALFTSRPCDHCALRRKWATVAILSRDFRPQRSDWCKPRSVYFKITVAPFSDTAPPAANNHLF